MTNKYGLIGEKLSHSYSKIIHEMAFQSIDGDNTYDLIELQPNELEAFVKEAKETYTGFNITIPYKIAIIPFLDSLSENAKAIGSVNTVLIKNGQAIGHNTDYDGFKMMLDFGDISVKNQNVVLLGNGGAAKAIIKYLKDEEAASIKIASRKPIKNDSNTYISYEEIEIIPSDIIINTTPVGMYPNTNDSPLTPVQLNNVKAIADIIYNPIDTTLIRQGQSLGIKTIGGLYMLVGQAIKAQEIWQNKSMPKPMIETIYEAIKKTL